MSKLKKRQSAAPSTKFIKEPSDPNSVPSEMRKPLFSFQYLVAEYCISCCEREDKAALADQLRILGSKTWAELRQAQRHKTGYEKIATNAIKAKFPVHLKGDDSVTFFAFRFSGNKPMIGYRDREIFHIIWLDRNYTVYDHG